MQQSSYLSTLLPAWWMAVSFAVFVPPETAAGQNRYRTIRQENFRRDPGPAGRLLGSVNAGVEVAGEAGRAGWVEVTIEGWIWAGSLRRSDSAMFDYAVGVRGGENLRTEPNGTVVARLNTGFLLREVEDRGAWVRVERTGWMWARSLERLEAAEPPGAAVDQPVQSGDARGYLERAVTIPGSALRRVPGGDTAATIAGDLAVGILARSGEWIRIRAEGWVHESELRPASQNVLVGVSGAEVRARPDDFEGMLLQWSLQLIALRTSDGTRREIPTGRQYMLVRGPLPEAGFVYVVLSDEQAREIERLPSLTQLIALVRVRVGRDHYLGNPVVDLVEMSLREQ